MVFIEVTAQSRRGHSPVKARSQPSQSEVTAQSRHLQNYHGSDTARSQLNHGPGHGSVTAGCDHFGHRELTVTVTVANFFLMGWWNKRTRQAPCLRNSSPVETHLHGHFCILNGDETNNISISVFVSLPSWPNHLHVVVVVIHVFICHLYIQWKADWWIDACYQLCQLSNQPMIKMGCKSVMWYDLEIWWHGLDRRRLTDIIIVLLLNPCKLKHKINSHNWMWYMWL